MPILKQQMNKEALQLHAQEIFAFNAQASQVPGVINLTLGEPNFSTPDVVKTAAKAAIDEQPLRYTLPQGKIELTQAIVDYVQRHYHLKYDPTTEVIATIGVTESVFVSLMSILNAGDEVLIPSPCFTIYQPIVQLLQCQPIMINTAATNFKLTPEVLQQTLAAHQQVKAIILNYPSNPTGSTYDATELQALATVLREAGIFVLSDEIYSELTYDVEHQSIAQLLPEQTILMNGLSKAFAMTGWRVGYICAPAAVAEPMIHVHELMTTSISTVSQAAAIAALTEGEADTQRMKDQYDQRRDVLYQGLLKLNFTVIRPQGAFYMFMKVPTKWQPQDDVQIAHDLLAAEKLAVLPGSYFGVGGAGYLRISYAASMADLQAALTAFENFSKKFN